METLNTYGVHCNNITLIMIYVSYVPVTFPNQLIAIDRAAMT